VLQRETAPGSFTDVVSYNDLNDTLHTESGLNTQNVRHRYRVQLWNDTPGNTFLSGSTRPATTVFLTINPGDRKNRLQWDFDVPWANTYYRIFRNAGSGSFQLVDSTASLSYTDDSWVNGNTYCYYIESVGAYQDTGLVNPILNRSQQACGTPIDNEPPCAPVISGNSDCEALRIELTWSVIDSCGADAGVFEIYFTPSGTGLPVLLATVYSPDSSYTYTATNSISGCYAILAVDTNGNRGELGAPICEGPCPEYELPNIFTPDNNQINDLFHPILPYRDVVRVDMRIFNRWGDQVFKTEDPFIGWNGTRNNEGVDCPEGVYFYICEVFETPDPLLNAQQTPRVLNGFIHLTRTTSP
jgi:gliding motility-associated-like protein